MLRPVNEMPDEPDLYFLSDPSSALIPVADLEPTKPPECQPGAVSRAEELMRRAVAGEIDRRPPISVARHGLGYRVLDGNATYGVAVRHGWRALPALLVEEPAP